LGILLKEKEKIVNKTIIKGKTIILPWQLGPPDPAPQFSHNSPTKLPKQLHSPVPVKPSEHSP